MTAVPPLVSGGLPMAGHGWEFLRDRQAFLRRAFKEKGRVFSFRLGPKRVAALIGPDLHDAFFQRTGRELRMDTAYYFLRDFFGGTGITATPEDYAADRFILHTPFRGGRLPRYVEIMAEEVERWLDTLDDSGEFELVNAMQRLTQGIVAHALMGRGFRQSLDEAFWRLYDTMSDGIDVVLPPNLPLPRFRRRAQATKAVRTMLAPLILERRKNPDDYDDFLRTFAEARYPDGSGMTDEKIVSLITGLIFAGHETTAALGSWTFIELMQHPDYCRRVRAEVDAAMAGGDAVDLELLKRCPSALYAVREAERLHPPGDILMRTVEEPFEAGGYAIPGKWLALVSPAIAQRDPDWFPHPHAFDPDRHAPGRAEDKQHRHAIITFGGGARKCVGLKFAEAEIQTMLALVLHRFELELDTPDPRAVLGMGAARPQAARVRYRRREASPDPTASAQAVVEAEGCPHAHAVKP